MLYHRLKALQLELPGSGERMMRYYILIFCLQTIVWCLESSHSCQVRTFESSHTGACCGRGQNDKERRSGQSRVRHLVVIATLIASRRKEKCLCANSKELTTCSWRADLPNPPVFGREPFKHTIKQVTDQVFDDLYDMNTQSGSQVC